MSKIIDFTKFKKKSEDSKLGFDLSVAKQVIKQDKELQRIIEALGVSEDEGALWIIQLSDLTFEIEKAVFEQMEKAKFHPAFSGLVVQCLANQTSSQLQNLGINETINKKMFLSMQKNAISAILSANHIDDLLSEDFDTGDTDVTT